MPGKESKRQPRCLQSTKEKQLNRQLVVLVSSRNAWLKSRPGGSETKNLGKIKLKRTVKSRLQDKSEKTKRDEKGKSSRLSSDCSRNEMQRLVLKTKENLKTSWIAEKESCETNRKGPRKNKKTENVKEKNKSTVIEKNA